MDRVTNAFTRKLAGLASLNEHEIALLDVEAPPIRLIAAHRDLIREGDKPGPVFVVLDGWACRYKMLVDEGVLRAWIVSIGRRDSLQRVAHLMLELYVRLRSIGLANDERCEMPLTQAVLADSLGLTPVHLNRVLKVLRERRAMTLTGGMLQLLDPRELVRIAGFDNNYLHRRVPDEVG